MNTFVMTTQYFFLSLLLSCRLDELLNVTKGKKIIDDLLHVMHSLIYFTHINFQRFSSAKAFFTVVYIISRAFMSLSAQSRGSIRYFEK